MGPLWGLASQKGDLASQLLRSWLLLCSLAFTLHDHMNHTMAYDSPIWAMIHLLRVMFALGPGTWDLGLRILPAEVVAPFVDMVPQVLAPLLAGALSSSWDAPLPRQSPE